MSVEEDIPQPTISAQKTRETTASTDDVHKATQSEIRETTMLAGEMPKSTLLADASLMSTSAEEIPRPCIVSSEETSQTCSETFEVLQPSSVDIHELVMRSNEEGQHTLA